MTARDRAKIRARFIKHLAGKLLRKELTVDNMVDFTAREVSRAVRAERAAFRDTEELRAAHLRRIDEQMIESMRKGKAR